MKKYIVFLFLITSSCFLLKSPWEWDRNRYSGELWKVQVDDDNTLPSLYLRGGYPYFENTVLVTVTLNGERKITALDMNGNTQWE